MNVTGIIAEYNPFHNGHLYQIEKIKKNGADFIVIVMSGDFLQRGTPAVLNKRARTRMALSAGADLVIELPSVFATASAQYFARGGVSILDKLGVVDTISFGCESDDMDRIMETASLLWKEPDNYKETLQASLKKGNSFPKAREHAVSAILGDTAFSFVSSPNTILALEYCIALLERNSDISIFPIKREGNSYHETSLTDNIFPSATAIRKAIQNGWFHNLAQYLPETVFSILTTEIQKQNLVWQQDFSQLLQYKLYLHENESFSRFADVSEDLSDKIQKNLRYYQNYDQFCELLKSKELTYSRINRALTHILLNITQDMYENTKKNDYASYARVLGFHKRALPLLSEIGKHSAIPLITKLADAKNVLSVADYPYLEKDIFCSHIYESITAKRHNIETPNEFTRQIIIAE